jgi:predicted dehydrogenase
MNKRAINVGVIGYGYWGPNLVRNFASLDESTVAMVADRDAAKLKTLSKLFPAVQATQDANALITSADVDAVAIATPVSSHYELAKAALLSGKHVLVEKPITATSEQAAELIALASDNSLVLMVDHTFIYTGAIRKIRELIDSGELGDLFYLDSERINLGIIQQDINVLWDLATHDLSILLHLIGEKPTAVQSIGYRHIGQQEEMAELNLNYESGFHAHIRVSWLSPVKMRLTMIGGSRKMIVYDDVEPSEKVRVYDKGIVLDLADEDVTTMKPIYRAGDVFIPKLDRTEALQAETAHFLDCIRRGRKPLTGGAEGLAVVRILEAAGRSLNANGDFVPLVCEKSGR